MAFELARVLDNIDWETIRDDAEAKPIHSTGSNSQECAPPAAVDTAPVLVEPAVDSNAHISPAGISLGPVQHLTGMPVLPYYVNSPPYHAQNMHTVHPAQRPGQGALPAVAAQTQPMVFAQPNNQLMYMPMPPYYQQPPCSQAAPQRQMYSPVQNAYYPQVVLLPPDGKVAQVVPNVSQNFCDYRTSPPAQVRPVTSAPHQRTQHQSQSSNTEPSSFAGNQGSYVYLLPGSQLPQGMPFFPQGVRVTNHYANSWMHAPPVKSAEYGCPSQGTPPSKTAETPPKAVAPPTIDGKEAGDVPSCPICGKGNFISENVLRSHMCAKHDSTEASLIPSLSDSVQKEPDCVACDSAELVN